LVPQERRSFHSRKSNAARKSGGRLTGMSGLCVVVGKMQ
jgi:hypothetical protein